VSTRLDVWWCQSLRRRARGAVLSLSPFSWRGACQHSAGGLTAGSWPGSCILGWIFSLVAFAPAVSLVQALITRSLLNRLRWVVSDKQNEFVAYFQGKRQGHSRPSHQHVMFCPLRLGRFLPLGPVRPLPRGLTSVDILISHRPSPDCISCRRRSTLLNAGRTGEMVRGHEDDLAGTSRLSGVK
jgi:hypothetical protein